MDAASTDIYPLSLHDALPISTSGGGSTKFGYNYGAGVKVRVLEIFGVRVDYRQYATPKPFDFPSAPRDRKSTRLNSSHANISYAVFCLKKKITVNRPERVKRR